MINVSNLEKPCFDLSIIVEPTLKGHKVIWHERARDSTVEARNKIQNDGTPFFINVVAVYECQHGKEKQTSIKKLEEDGKKQVLEIKYFSSRNITN